MERELLYKKIYDDLIDGILNGTYPSGSKLPSEKELMDQYSVSRITSKKALEMLADRNVIVRMPGKGSFVLDSSKVGEEPSFTQPLPIESEKSKKMIGVVLDSFGTVFGCDIVAGIEHECWSKNYNMVLKCTYGSVDDEAKAIDELVNLGVDGIILMCAQGEAYNANVMKLSIEKFPMVLIDRELKGLPIPFVGTDNYAAARELVDILVDEGHTDICFVSRAPLQTSSVANRFSGYRDALMDHNILTNEDMWLTDLNEIFDSTDDLTDAEDLAMKEIEQYVEKHPQVSAYFAVDESMGAMTYKVLQQMGLGNKKEVVFFDGIEERFNFHPNFTHVMQGQYMIGAVSVKTLCRIIKGKEVESQNYIPYTIVRKK
ncbi:MAG: GntR family transcriptional regulator [Acetatifactor sp.]|nr:GntR family transcriptional regulator [Acetatifactor sp.]